MRSFLLTLFIYQRKLIPSTIEKNNFNSNSQVWRIRCLKFSCKIVLGKKTKNAA